MATTWCSSRAAPSGVGSVELEEHLRRSARLATMRCASTVKLEVELEPGLPACRADDVKAPRVLGEEILRVLADAGPEDRSLPSRRISPFVEESPQLPPLLRLPWNLGHGRWKPLPIEHHDGIVRNNIVANCSDTGIYINASAQSGVWFNTVIGAGPIGLGAAIFSRIAGHEVTLLDMSRERLDFAARELGFGSAIGPVDDIAAQVRDITNGEGFQAVFDATGNRQAMERGFRFVAHGGKYVLVSIVRDAISFADPEFHKREMTLLGSRNATMEDFQTVLTAMRAGSVPDRALNTHRLPLHNVPADFATLLDPAQRVIKAIVEC